MGNDGADVELTTREESVDDASRSLSVSERASDER
jgi:hypothetical protein